MREFILSLIDLKKITTLNYNDIATVGRTTVGRINCCVPVDGCKSEFELKKIREQLVRFVIQKKFYITRNFAYFVNRPSEGDL